MVQEYQIRGLISFEEINMKAITRYGSDLDRADRSRHEFIRIQWEQPYTYSG
ncbi:hypothetical protein D3C75_1172090 [compost metagenome]